MVTAQYTSLLKSHVNAAQLTFTCWKSTMETIEKCVKYVQR